MSRPATPEAIKAALVEMVDQLEEWARQCFMVKPDEYVDKAYEEEDPEGYAKWRRAADLVGKGRPEPEEAGREPLYYQFGMVR